MDNRSGRLREERGTIVRLSPKTAVSLQRAALAAVERLRGEGGYWRLARPEFIGETAPGAGAGEWQGRWEGVTWLYGKKASVTLHLTAAEGTCAGTWRITATEPPTETAIPLENCVTTAERLQFTVTPLFMTSETHMAWMEEGQLHGQASMYISTPYLRRGGTWTLHRVTP